MTKGEAFLGRLSRLQAGQRNVGGWGRYGRSEQRTKDAQRKIYILILYDALAEAFVRHGADRGKRYTELNIYILKRNFVQLTNPKKRPNK